MKKQHDISACVYGALRTYFDDLDGEKPASVYDMVLKSVERPMLEVVMAQAGGQVQRPGRVLDHAEGRGDGQVGRQARRQVAVRFVALDPESIGRIARRAVRLPAIDLAVAGEAGRLKAPSLDIRKAKIGLVPQA